MAQNVGFGLSGEWKSGIYISPIRQYLSVNVNVINFQTILQINSRENIGPDRIIKKSRPFKKYVLIES